MSLARLSAGEGYRYLLRHTACGDCARDASTPLTSYYAASGYPPGRWIGNGLTGLDDGRGLAARATVSEEAMGRLFGSGQDPVTGRPLGRPYPVYRSAEDRIAAAVVRLPDNLDEDARTTAIAAIERREHARPVRAAVAGYDLTFTVPKSASVLWALGDTATQQAVTEAHEEAVTAVLGLIEDRFLRTRTGKQSCVQVETRGIVAAAFTHWDTRTGDPNLHTHVVIANKVQGPDGLWRAVDSRALHLAAVACSETYDVMFADSLAARLPVSWSHRSRGERRNPAFEIDGVPEPLLTEFSERTSQIDARMRDLLHGFRVRHDRAPTRREVLQLRQQATLATRPDKTVRPLAELFPWWRQRASAVSGWSAQHLRPGVEPSVPHTTAAQGLDATVKQLAGATLTAIGERRSTWTRPNLLAEAARVTREIRTASPADRLALLDRVVDSAVEHCVALDPPEVFNSPPRFRRADGTSAFTRSDAHAFTTEAVLAAEARLVAATEAENAPRVDATVVAAAVDPPTVTEDPVPRRLRAHLTADQRHAVEAIASSGRAMEVLVGPAGTGKTRTLRAIRSAWESGYGPGSVVGLAPSATAAAELCAALGIACENTAKWVHDTVASGGHAALRRDQLLVVDEASMVSTAHLDALVNQAGGCGAKVVLVGDHQQLGAVDAGGAFGLLAQNPHALTLVALWRFRHRWEANATRGLRVGNPAALAAYAEHDRLREGPAEVMRDQAYAAWTADVTAGRSALLIAADRATVRSLNARAHDERIDTGAVQPDGVPIADQATCGRGDVVVSRRNDRRLTLTDGGHVRNGALWQVTGAHQDGSLDVAAVPRPGAMAPATPARVRLPASYVREHIELGYAATIHRAQGMTVEVAHALAAPGMTRQALYVAMTRGREANRVYVVTDGRDRACQAPPDPVTPVTGRQILERVLATDGTELSATAMLRVRQNEATSFGRLSPIRDTLTAASDPACDAAADEITALLRRRAAAMRESAAGRPWFTGARPPLTSIEPIAEGIHR